MRAILSCLTRLISSDGTMKTASTNKIRPTNLPIIL